MQLNLHPMAEENFNRRAEELFQLLQEVPRQSLTRRPVAFQPDIQPSGVLTEDDIIDIHYRLSIDPLTFRPVELLFDDGNRAFRLDHRGCLTAERLAEEFAARSELRELTGRSFIQSMIFKWLRQRLTANEASLLSQYVLATLTREVKLYQVWIPIANLYFESPLRVGKVTFRTISRTTLHYWYEQYARHMDNERLSEFEPRFQKQREKLQGLAAAVMDIQAEREHAVSVAVAEADRVTALLRIFAPENLSPFTCSYLRPLGMECLESYTAYVMGVNGTLFRHCHTVGAYPSALEIGEHRIGLLRDAGLQKLIELIEADPRSNFQNKLVEALLLYSKNTVTKDPAEKLTFILVAIETLLLRNESEPVQQNIAERMAFVIGRSREDRRSIVRLVKECYGFRSKFVHHGETLSQLESLMEFMRRAWRFFATLLQWHDRFASKENLLDDLDDRKLA